MPDSLGRRVVRIGICIAAFGVVFNLLLGALDNILSKLSLFDNLSIATLCLELVGLLVAFVGSVIWACTEDRLISLLTWGLSVAIGAFVIVELFDASIMRPTAILLPVFYAAELASGFILIIAALRFLSDRWQSRSR
jgi:hypothetical protein